LTGGYREGKPPCAATYQMIGSNDASQDFNMVFQLEGSWPGHSRMKMDRRQVVLNCALANNSADIRSCKPATI
jgi:hypothetical protein